MYNNEYNDKFKVNNLKDNEVGNRIKRFSYKFFKISQAIFVIYIFLFGFGFLASLINAAEYSGGLVLLTLLFGAVIACAFYLVYCVIYFSFIKSVGMGIIVQDINEIKTKLGINDKDLKHSVKAKKEEDILYCDNCGAETKESDKACPGCGIPFED